MSRQQAASTSPREAGASYDEPSVRRQLVSNKNQSRRGPWASFARLLTCCAPSYILTCIDRKYEDENVRQAWREKVALCFVIFLVSGFLLFLTLGLRPTLCPDSLPLQGREYVSVKDSKLSWSKNCTLS
jgi:hypothetical protein